MPKLGEQTRIWTYELMMKVKKKRLYHEFLDNNKGDKPYRKPPI